MVSPGGPGFDIGLAQSSPINLSFMATRHMSGLTISALHEARVALLLLSSGRKARGQLAQVALPKEEADHVLFDQLDALWVRRAQVILIDDGSESFKPLFPTFLRYIPEDALSQGTRVRWPIKAFGLVLQ